MRPLPVRAVFFDVVGTLLHPEPSAAAVYAGVGRRHGSALAAAEIGRRFRAAFAAEEERDRANGLRTDEERERARWRDLVGGVLDDVGDRAGCFAELWEHFRRPGAWRADPDGLAAVRRLTKRGLVLGLASNFDRRLLDVLEGFGELRALPHVVVSSEVGWRKPAAEFFAALARRTGLAPGEIAFVGDDAVNDYRGATAAGLRAVLLDPPGRDAWEALAADLGGA